jgi:hypothetical protein
MNCIKGGVKGVQSHGKGNIHSVFDICFTNLTKHSKIVRASMVSLNDGHAIVCPPVRNRISVAANRIFHITQQLTL